MSPAKAPLRILFVDDDEDEFFLLEDLLRDTHFNGTLEWEATYDGALNRVREKQDDMIILDYRMGGRSGLDLLRVMREEGVHAPIVLLTGQGGAELDQQALEAGASDYLNKNAITGPLLERSLRYCWNRHLVSQNLRQERSRYRSLFENSQDGIALCDEEFWVYETNEAFTEFFEVRVDVHSPRVLADVLQDPQFEQALHTQVENGAREFKLPFVDKRRKREYLVSVARIRQLEGEFGYHILFSDVSDVKRAERASRANERLEFAHRLIQLVAHEVRNPLTNVNLAAQQLAELGAAASADDQTMYLEMITRNAERIQELVSRILDSGQPAEIVPAPVRFDQVVSQALAGVQDRIQIQGVSVNMDLSSITVELPLDDDKLQLALRNIFSNALEAMTDTQDPVLRIQGFQRNQSYCLNIEDNGKGMSVETMHRIFEPFFTNRMGGKGLGMTLTQKVVAAHGGSIEVDSELGVGTTMTLVLPAQG